MDIHQLRAFCSVYKNRSFSKASRELFVSQPTISDHIKTLEETLDLKLFDRLGRSIAPTEESTALYPRAVELIKKLDAIKSDIRLDRSEPSGELLLGASSAAGSFLVPQAAASFKSLYPEVTFRFVVGDSRSITSMVMDLELPAGIVDAVMERKSLDFTCIANDELVLVCAEGMGPAEMISPEELYRLPLVVRQEGSGTKLAADGYLINKGVPPGKLNVTASFNSNFAVLEAVRAGLGAGVVPRFCVSQELEKGHLREIKIKGLKMRQNFYVLANKKRTIPGVLKLFLGHLKSMASGLRASPKDAS